MDILVSAEGMPSASNINGLTCQTFLTAHVDPQRVFSALSTLIVERDDGPYQVGLHDGAPGFETRAFAEAVAVREGRRAPVL